MPEAKDLHVDAVLTNISKKYSNEELIWNQITPLVGVKKRSDIYYVYNRAEQFRLPDDKMGPKSVANETDFTVTTDNYSVKDYALSEFVSIAEEENADAPLSPRADATEFITNLLQLAQEKRVADLVFAAGTYPSANKIALTGNDQWSAVHADSDPIADIMAALDACFVRPNTMVLGRLVFTKLRTHSVIVNAIKAMAGATVNNGMVSRQDLANFFEIENVLVGRAKYTSSKEGQTEATADIWGKHCALMSVKKAPTLRSVTFGATFQEMPLQTAIIPDPKRGVKGGNLIKVAWNSDVKIIASDLGYFIENAIA